MTKLPKCIYVATEPDATGEYLIAWRLLTSADSGLVGVYELVEVIEKRDTVEVRRKGSKTWVKSLLP